MDQNTVKNKLFQSVQQLQEAEEQIHSIRCGIVQHAQEKFKYGQYRLAGDPLVSKQTANVVSKNVHQKLKQIGDRKV